jgi:hypothetical protein
VGPAFAFGAKRKKRRLSRRSKAKADPVEFFDARQRLRLGRPAQEHFWREAEKAKADRVATPCVVRDIAAPRRRLY